LVAAAAAVPAIPLKDIPLLVAPAVSASTLKELRVPMARAGQMKVAAAVAVVAAAVVWFH
jgi:hypothetical protein